MTTNVNGTKGNDLIDQRLLGPLSEQNIYVLAGAGDDTIFVSNGSIEGEAGNDTITALSSIGVSALYWGSPIGIVANLATGRVEDGYGTVDTLIGVRMLGGSPNNDSITGSASNDVLIGNGGSDTIRGNGGIDRVIYFGLTSSDAQIEYNPTTDTFVIKRLAGDLGTDTLQNIDTVSFTGDGVDITKYGFGGIFKQTKVVGVTLAAGSFVGEVRPGDFNGDGVGDILLVQSVGTGTGAAPMLIFLGDGLGKYVEGSSSVFAGGFAKPSTGATTPLVSDFNKDGITDIFNLGLGNDTPPFPGGTNSLFLSDPSTKKISDQSKTLSQVLDGNHGGGIGDANGDGFPDVLVSALGDGNVLLLNDGSGHFISRPDLIPRPYMLGSTTQRYTASWSSLVDVNGDGKVDAIIGKWAGGSSFPNSHVLINDGTGDFSKAKLIPLPPSAVQGESILDIQPIDLNGDNLADLLVSLTSNDGKTSYTTPYIQILLNLGNGVFRDETQLRLPQATMASTNNFGKLYPTDIDNDGYQDIVVSGGGVVPSYVFRNQGDGKFVEFWKSSLGALTVPADINKDGMIDLLSYSPTGSIISYQNTLNNGHVYKQFFGQGLLKGSPKDDLLKGGLGNDTIDGGAGMDTALYGTNTSKYTITNLVTNGTCTFTVEDKTGADGIDTLVDIERLQFSDRTVALDISGTAGQAYRVYQAAFNRTPDNGGLKYWIGLMDGGVSLPTVSSAFIASAEFKALYGVNPTNEVFISKLYDNVLHRAPDIGGYNYWVGLLNTKMIDNISTLINFSESTENQAGVIGVIQNGIELLN